MRNADETDCFMGFKDETAERSANLRRKESKRAALRLQTAVSEWPLPVPRRAEHRANDAGGQTPVAGGDAGGVQGVVGSQVQPLKRMMLMRTPQCRAKVHSMGFGRLDQRPACLIGLVAIGLIADALASSCRATAPIDVCLIADALRIPGVALAIVAVRLVSYPLAVPCVSRAVVAIGLVANVLVGPPVGTVRVGPDGLAASLCPRATSKDSKQHRGEFVHVFAP